ncbi:hypothetical protein ZOD2009_11460 [Haladaptatus paucihalophilus DX253]|uniref:Uncharacterized protein n=2 Tax=Haladaptatus TaxID=367188 RepID=E7QU12_HALPU|nr:MULTISPECIES: hypothetical protein [Haladaptatus]EFW92091.1 hypothetical protein ZOD2009_11460 [Haladaptatus paucihalophilus DX253]ODR81874.1 hypothetical protein BG842_24205 [Haladaptatus sp. W1]ODR81876.1 hypothetical protein BG842_24215 [Haladaptatus sp. W1]SHK88244.1 hypothetical protein SAMN05444342_2498 [Haladaptatus paucihalophilus DX253]GKZ14247.1 hypothetical protein HAL_21280 [Haladaptatus sp. T7]
MNGQPDSGDIPAGWERAPIRGDEIQLQHEDGSIAVKAVKATISDEWELELEDSIGNRYTTIRPVGRVATRDRAVSALVSFAREVNDLRHERGEVLPDDIVREVQRSERVPV